MTVQDTQPSVTYVGDNIQTVFSFTFRVDDISWLSVDFVTNFDQFTANPDQDNNPGGSAIYLVAPPALQELTILRTTPLDQQLDYSRYDPFDSESTEDAFDKGVMQLQDRIFLFDEHVNDLNIHYPDAPADGLYYVRRNNVWIEDPNSAATDHLALINIGVNTHAQIDAHIANATIHYGDAPATGDDYARNNNAWVISPPAVNDHTLLSNIGVNTHAQIDTHIADSTIHFLEASIDHTAIANIGSNTHVGIDNHIANAGIHFIQAAIDHTAILNIGTNSHAQIDTHIATADIHFADAPADAQDYVRNNNAWAVAGAGGVTDHFLLTNIGVNTHVQIDAHIADGTIHFAQGAIDHTAILNIGVNTHAQIDTHIADATIHFTEASIDHTAIGNIGVNTHAAIDTHIADGTIHFLEGAIDHVNILSIGVNTHANIDTHIADGTIHFLEAAIDHANILNIGVNSHAAIDTHIADGTIHFTEGSIDHGNLLGLADDDHINYFYALGRAGGQSMIGGTGAVESIELRGSSNADLGTIFMQSPVEFQSISASGAPYAFNYNATELYTAGFIGGGLNMSGVITFTNTTMIYESFRGSPQINTGANPGFAAYTVLQALPSLRSGAGAGHNPLNALVINAGPSFTHLFGGTRTVGNMTGMSVTGSGVTNGGVGGTLNFTNHAAVTYRPQWNTGVGSVVNFGACTGLRCQNPGQALFGSSAGTELLGSYVGLQMDNITLSNGVGTAVRRALRSALVLNSQNLMIENTGGAESDFGSGDIHLDDNTFLKLGGTVLAPDILQGWDTGQAAIVFSTFFGIGANPLYLRPSATDTWTFQHSNSGTADIGLGFNVNAVSFGVVDPTPNSNNWFVRFEGPNNRQVQSAGVYSDVLWTAGGTIDVNGLAATEINSFRIDANVTALNGGSVLDQSGLNIAGMGFPGSGLATRIQSLRVTGRARVDGAMNHGSFVAAQLTASVNDYQLGLSNSQRSINLLTSDAAWNITGIDITGGNTYGQPGDRICLHNVGAFNITLTHQDVASLAVHRIITSTGVGYVIGPDECVWLWYDDTGAARWRMQEGTGA